MLRAASGCAGPSCRAAVLALLCAAAGHGAALAQGFAAAVSPPRFEVQIEPGVVMRRSVDITQAPDATGRYRVYTADWQLSDEHGLGFFEKIQPGSCRPWVAIEAREVELRPGQRMRYRFEISPPADATPRECRFAIMFEGAPSEVSADGLSFPVNGRIAVVVYAALGDVSPLVEIVGAEWADSDGQKVPALRMRNVGAATARPAGAVAVEFGAGGPLSASSTSPASPSSARRMFSPTSKPILPGATALVPLVPEDGQPVSRSGGAFSVNGALDLGYAAKAPLAITNARRDE